MKVVLYMAMSLNGNIATENGQEDFLSHENWKTFEKFTEEIKCIIIGRKTYEAVKKWKDYNFDTLNNVHKIVVSNKNLKLGKKYSLANSPREAIEIMSKKGFNEAILTGGSLLNSSFIQENLIDEIIINIEPVIMGRGLRLFSDAKFENRLNLIDIKKLSEDIIQVHYKVRKLGS
jgi:dihydrofolate reductase